MRDRPLPVLLLVLLASILLAACGGSGSGADGGGDAGGPSSATPDETFEVDVKDGAVVGGPETFKVNSGDVVQLTITSDVDDQVHVHGPNVEADLPAGEATDVEFRTGAAGSYEIELHGSGALVGTLEVR